MKNLLALDTSYPKLSPPWRVEKLQDRLNRDVDRYPQMEDAATTLVTAEVTVDAIRL